MGVHGPLRAVPALQAGPFETRVKPAGFVVR
jgi:hypothetical protein